MSILADAVKLGHLAYDLEADDIPIMALAAVALRPSSPSLSIHPVSSFPHFDTSPASSSHFPFDSMSLRKRQLDTHILQMPLADCQVPYGPQGPTVRSFQGMRLKEEQRCGLATTVCEATSS